MTEEVAKVFYRKGGEGGEWTFGPYPGTSGVLVRRKEGEPLEKIAERNGFPLDLVKQAFGASAAKELREEADELVAEAKADEPAKPAKHHAKKKEKK